MALSTPGARLDEGLVSPPNTTSSRRRAHSRSPGRLRWPGLAALSLALLAGCAGSTGAAPAKDPAQGAAPEQQEPFDLEKALSREAGELPAREIRAGAWSARALAAEAPKIVEKEKLVSVAIPIGTDSHVECFVYNTMLDSGEVIRQFVELLEPGKVEIARIVPWEISVHRDSPAVFLQALYSVPTGGGKAAGLLKIAMHADKSHPVACLHDELGYLATFERLAKGIFDSFEAKDALPAPEYTETLILRADKMPIGFETNELIKEAGGQRRWFSRSTSLLPRDARTLEIEDEASNVLLDAQGRIKAGLWVEMAGGKANHRMELSQKAGSQYEYAGEVEGKRVQGSFTAPGKSGLASPVSIASELARLMKDKGPFDVKQQEYEPGMDPTKPTEVRYARDPSGAVTVSFLTMRLTGALAPDGRPEAFEISAGPPRLTLQRAHSRGKL
ncbi:hypothetical protein [Sorangium cellulosum]|nr:hypothetical protein [Sorangium cellulosum]